MEVKNVNIDELRFAEYNPREITDKSFEDLKNSLKEFGFVEPAVVNANNEIIGGHMRVRAAKETGMEEVPVVYVNLTDDKAKILNLALNRITGRWATEKLSELITELKSSDDLDLTLSGFEDQELDYYNVGPDKFDEELNSDNLTGQISNESYILTFAFDKEEDAQKVSTFLNDGKYLKLNEGTKLLELINGLKE